MKRLSEIEVPGNGVRGPEVQLNLNVRGLPLSATVAINEVSDRLRSQGRRIFKMGLGQSPFPVPEPVIESLRANAHQKDYLPVRGLPALREAVARHHYREFGIDYTPDEVLVGPGSKELMFILQLVYYGDLVIPTPTWVSYAPQAQIIGRHVRFLPTSPRNGWRMTTDQLEELCSSDPSRPRLLILNYPSNPTGGTYSEADLERLAEVTRKYRVILLSDEIYGKLHHEGAHRSIVPFYPEGTIFSGGLSKWCGAGGWRLGLFVFPPGLKWLQDAMAAVASETYTSTSAPIQYAAVSAFEDDPEIERYLDRSRRVLRALGRHLASSLIQAGIRVAKPRGGFYLFADFRGKAKQLRAKGIRTSPALCKRLLDETGVAILPGSVFGRRPEELTARISYVNFDGAGALEGVARTDSGTGSDELDTSFLREHCNETLEAVERLCKWVDSTDGGGGTSNLDWRTR
jgi:aspartate aminotransferase